MLCAAGCWDSSWIILSYSWHRVTGSLQACAVAVVSLATKRATVKFLSPSRKSIRSQPHHTWEPMKTPLQQPQHMVLHWHPVSRVPKFKSISGSATTAQVVCNVEW